LTNPKTIGRRKVILINRGLIQNKGKIIKLLENRDKKNKFKKNDKQKIIFFFRTYLLKRKIEFLILFFLRNESDFR
jgi:hypothetical protein